MSDEELTEFQVEALELLLEVGGDMEWIPTKDLAHPKTIEALFRKGIIQLAEIDGRQHAVIAGVVMAGDDGILLEEST